MRADERRVERGAGTGTDRWTPKKPADPKQLALVQAVYNGGQTDVETICRTLGVSRATLCRYVTPRTDESAIYRTKNPAK